MYKLYSESILKARYEWVREQYTQRTHSTSRPLDQQFLSLTQIRITWGAFLKYRFPGQTSKPIMSPLVKFQRSMFVGSFPGDFRHQPSLDALLLFNNKRISSVQFSRSVMSDSLRPHELQHTRPPCSSPSTGVHSDSHPSSS